ncbi:MAG: sigma-54-dependent Fis family transcriptional regulator [Candidatus Riflebacteria bacterium]|nr:sigma-54-dependent Fis family transcriptional regulator [Candidatus Riflebacteria bacterium]
MTPVLSSTSPFILLVDDETSVLYTLEAVLRKEGYRTERAVSASEALARIEETVFDLIISDVNMPGESGLDLLDAVKRRDPESLMVLITAYGSEALAVDAMKRGAYDYLPKPFANDDLKLTVRRALEKRLLQRENRLLRERLVEREGLGGIIGGSEGMQQVYELIEKVAPNDVTVLITGESGTGKELVANAIHGLSPRRSDAFIRVNCAALPENLIESELFGFERGAFSGAVARRLGKFEQADHGTIFLDEIGDMTPATQTKILRILQEREFERIGGQSVIKVDTRVIAATNRDLSKAIRDGNFREDLFYRLNVVNIQLPPLRDRRSDIMSLVWHFAARFCEKFHKPPRVFSDAFIAMLMQYSWPGNVRELQNLIERVIILEDENMFQSSALAVHSSRAALDSSTDETSSAGGTPIIPRAGPPAVATGDSQATQPVKPDSAGMSHQNNVNFVSDAVLDLPYREAKEMVLNGFERKFFSALLSKADGNISKAARAAGMHRKNLYMKLKEHEILRRDQTEDDGSVDDTNFEAGTTGEGSKSNI